MKIFPAPDDAPWPIGSASPASTSPQSSAKKAHEWRYRARLNDATLEGRRPEIPPEASREPHPSEAQSDSEEEDYFGPSGVMREFLLWPLACTSVLTLEASARETRDPGRLLAAGSMISRPEYRAAPDAAGSPFSGTRYEFRMSRPAHCPSGEEA